MEIDFAALADAATVDASGKLNILGVFDRIQAAEFPVRHGRVSLVFRLSAGTGEFGAHKVLIQLSDPSGKEMLRLDGRMELGGGPRGVAEGIKVPHILNLDGIVFPAAGRYSFEISVDGVELHSLPLTLDEVRGAPAGPRSGGGYPETPFIFEPGEGAQA